MSCELVDDVVKWRGVVEGEVWQLGAREFGKVEHSLAERSHICIQIE